MYTPPKQVLSSPPLPLDNSVKRKRTRSTIPRLISVRTLLLVAHIYRANQTNQTALFSTGSLLLSHQESHSHLSRHVMQIRQRSGPPSHVLPSNGYYTPYSRSHSPLHHPNGHISLHNPKFATFSFTVSLPLSYISLPPQTLHYHRTHTIQYLNAKHIVQRCHFASDFNFQMHKMLHRLVVLAIMVLCVSNSFLVQADTAPAPAPKSSTTNSPPPATSPATPTVPPSKSPTTSPPSASPKISPAMPTAPATTPKISPLQSPATPPSASASPVPSPASNGTPPIPSPATQPPSAATPVPSPASSGTPPVQSPATPPPAAATPVPSPASSGTPPVPSPATPPPTSSTPGSAPVGAPEVAEGPVNVATPEASASIPSSSATPAESPAAFPSGSSPPSPLPESLAPETAQSPVNDESGSKSMYEVRVILSGMAIWAALAI